MESKSTRKPKKPLISISIPIFNEEKNLSFLYNRLTKLADTLEARYDLEFVFSDNHSDDNTWRILAELAEQDSRVKALRFSKNFGFQRSILANYMHTQGDAVMQLDADLQDPPELLEVFLEEWENGYLVVYGIRKKRMESYLLTWFRKAGYLIIDKFSEHPIPRDAGDFRLIDRKVIQSLEKMKTIKPYLRGMIAGLGFDQIGVEYDRDARTEGESKFNVYGLFRLGLSATISHSTIPLRAAFLLGLIMLFTSTLGSIYYIFLKLSNPNIPQGLASMHILVLFGIGLNSVFLGIIGEYILRIYLLLRSEPIAIIEQSLNFEADDLKL